MKKWIFARKAILLLLWALTLEASSAEADATALSRQQTLQNFGLSQSHQSDEASFAFERVLMLDPNNQAALFGLGKANFELKNYLEAERNFTQLLSLKPSPSLRQAAQAYLEKIQLIQIKSLTRTIGYLRVEEGYDSNANLAPRATILGLPDGSFFPLFPTSIALPSQYSNVSAGFAVYHTINKNETFYLSLSGFQRFNYAPLANLFNFGLTRSAIGLVAKKGAWRFDFPLEFQMLNFDNYLFRYAFINGIDISRPIGNNVIGFVLQSQFLSFPRNSTQNGHVLFGAFDWTYRFPTVPLEFITRWYGADGESMDQINNFLTDSYLGVQILARWNGFVRIKPYASLNLQRSFYRGPHDIFLITRHDDFYNIVLGLEWRLSRSWYLTPSFSHAENFSNIALNRNQRNLYQVGLEYRIY